MSFFLTFLMNTCTRKTHNFGLFNQTKSIMGKVEDNKDLSYFLFKQKVNILLELKFC